MDNSRRSFLKSITGAAATLPLLASKAVAAESGSVPKRKFGRHDDMLSVIGFGGHTLKFAESQEVANQICDRAIDRGINFFENAWTYHGGTSEEIMGKALKGKRDKVFLMTKFSTYNDRAYPDNKAGALKMLEDSLRRLQTDHLDLWMLHNVKGDAAKQAYESDSAIEALETARQQGKIRYVGFTGHTTPQIHIDLIEGGYEWDATLMPVSILGALSSRPFEKEVMPLCEKNNIAVLGMKGFGGSRRAHMHGLTTVDDVVRYALSYPQVCTHAIGVDKVEYVDPAAIAATKTPMTENERSKHMAEVARRGGAQFAMYLDPEYDECYSRGSFHPSQIA
ncbi:MAG: aldo/keto reductase [Verrucomicrobiota bacterium]